jgi:hypothetical protein
MYYTGKEKNAGTARFAIATNKKEFRFASLALFYITRNICFSPLRPVSLALFGLLLHHTNNGNAVCFPPFVLHLLPSLFFFYIKRKTAVPSVSLLFVLHLLPSLIFFYITRKTAKQYVSLLFYTHNLDSDKPHLLA